ncbi:IS1 family transposase [Xenorhabdus japonica]|uniref:Tn3 transposase DDE domain-containing protein n=1 Tax=Xenorhabdus japonica TaxID=53341 RepID=A0A1I5E8J8_9GAMM|nr:IS1 family transposase [Xenorhabdus japonica]SFO07673.1 Tn3 transposase DDE domain-containing protein [Xenorhabdus japonica]
MSFHCVMLGLNKQFEANVSADVDIKLKKPIKRKLIEQEWDQIQHIICLPSRQVTQQSTVIRKLSGNKRNNRTQLALHVYDRLIKCLSLHELLAFFHISFITTDGWGSYVREVELGKYLVGKIFTQRIEQQNFNLHIHINRLTRKTVCYSHSIEIQVKYSIC